MTDQNNSSKLRNRHAAILQEWENECRNHPEDGGDGFVANLKTAKEVIHRFGGTKFRQALNDTGMGSHPEMLRFAWKVGQALKQRPRNQSKRIHGIPPRLGKLFYPDLND